MSFMFFASIWILNIAFLLIIKFNDQYFSSMCFLSFVVIGELKILRKETDA